MTILTLLRYLLGSREAILRVARSPQSVGLGLMFVLAAGFAREYDGEDLLHEPWHLLIPLAASLGTSAALYSIVHVVALRRGALERPFLGGYLDFLGLYCMTAPLALLYAIPFERIFSAADSVRVNLGLLALVALWRVLLMTRVVSVVFDASFVAALFVVMFFADTLAAFILVATPLPIVSIMGGIRLSESENVLRDIVFSLRALTILTWPIWAIGAARVALRREPAWQYVPATGESRRVAWHLWALGAAPLVAWAFVLPFTQPEQQLRRSVERDLRTGRIAEGLATMSAHQPSDFPPHWDPPPRIAYREQTPDIVELREQLERTNVSPWVRDIYAAKFGNWLHGEDDYHGRWVHFEGPELERQVAFVERASNRAEIVRENEAGLRWIAEFGQMDDGLTTRIRKLFREAGLEEPDTSQPSAEIPAQQNGEPSRLGDSP